MTEPRVDDEADASEPAPGKSADELDVFGTVLPEQTGDDRDSGDWREELGRDRDDELREDVPPHY